MTEVKLIGLLLIFGTSLALWWIFLPEISKRRASTEPRPPLFLWGGWGVILLLCLVYGWWINGTAPATVSLPPQVSSTNQSGGITAHTVNIDKFITMEASPNPHVKSAPPIRVNVQTGDGYETVFPFTIESPHSVGYFRVEVCGSTVQKINLEPEQMSAAMQTSSRKGKNGCPFHSIMGAYGTFKLSVLTSDPISPANKITIRPIIE